MHVGVAKDDSLWNLRADARGISVDAFWMDETEVTNGKYKQLVFWVRDSIIRERLADPAYGGNEDYKITEDRDGNRKEYSCDGSHEIQVPLVVLVNGNSASASEILAGAIQDYGIGTLVGTTTFGKGIVQQIMPFTDGSAIKITISAYYTPNGRNIHGTGIEPDVECEFDGDAYYNSDTPVDNQLEKAKEVLKDLMK